MTRLIRPVIYNKKNNTTFVYLPQKYKFKEGEFVEIFRVPEMVRKDEKDEKEYFK